VQSSVFKEQLANNVSQLILNKTPEVVEQLVEFLYRGRCSNAQPYAKELFLLGEEYKVEKLKVSRIFSLYSAQSTISNNE
jgi:hypothetical protein